MSLYQSLTSNSNHVKYDVTFKDVTVDSINGNSIPSIGTMQLSDIPIRNPTGALTPFLTDSNMGIIESPLPSTTGQFLDLNRSIPGSHIIGYLVSTPRNFVIIDANLQSIPGNDADVIIGNTSVTSKDITILNQSGGGIGSRTVIAGSQETLIEEQMTGNSLRVNDTGISLQYASSNNFINIDSGGIQSVVLGPGQNNVMASDGLAVVQSYNNKVIIQELVSNNLIQCSANGVIMLDGTNQNSVDVSSLNNNIVLKNTINNNTITIDSNTVQIDSNDSDINLTSNNANINLTSVSSKLDSLLSSTIQELTDGHYLAMNGGGVTLASNNLKPLTLATDDQLRLKASSSYGLSEQVLTSNGSGFCEWSLPKIINQSLYRLTNLFPNASSIGPFRIFNESGQAMSQPGVNNTTNSINYLYINPSDYPATISGKVPRLQLVYSVITNSVSPASSFTTQLYTYASLGTALQFIINTSTSYGNPATVTLPLAGTTTTVSSTPFALPVSATTYICVLSNSAITASFTQHTVYLKLIYV
jgi:hypothetical protein